MEDLIVRLRAILDQYEASRTSPVPGWEEAQEQVRAAYPDAQVDFFHGSAYILNGDDVLGSAKTIAAAWIDAADGLWKNEIPTEPGWYMWKNVSGLAAVAYVASESVTIGTSSYNVPAYLARYVGAKFGRRVA